MPQLQPGDFAPQLIWLAITFVCLFFAMSQLALPRVARVIGERKTRISKDIDEARESQKLAEEEMTRYEAEIASAKAKAQSALRTSREKLDAELAKQRSLVDRDLASKTAEGEENIRGFMERSASQLEAMTGEVVSDIVRQLAGVEVSDEEVHAALRQSLKE